MQLVFHQAALGDFVLALPTLRRLGSQAEAVTLVVPWSHGRVAARLMPEARVLDIEMFEFTRLWSEGGPSTMSPAVAEVFGDVTHVVNFVANAESTWTKNVSRVCGGAPILTVPPRPPHDWTMAVHAWHAEQLAASHVALCPISNETKHGSPLRTDVWQPGAPRRWVIHPGSGGVAKCWPIARYATLRQQLVERGDDAVFLLGPAEVERGVADKLRDQFEDTVNLREIREIDDLFFALNEATHYLGNDAGPTHVAAQLGLPTTALFGPTDPRVWAPVGPRVRVIAPPQPTLITWLTVDALLDQLDVD
ncbi:MAG: glycosyltransferase family 9 protein [Planctomycetota bacterium]